MSKGLSKQQSAILGLLRGSVKRQCFAGSGELATSELVEELIAQGLLCDSTPHKQRLSAVRRACDSLQRRGLTESYIKKVLESCKFKIIRDLSPSRVGRWLADLRSTGRSMRTSNAYLIAIKGFSRWLVRERRSREDYLSHLQRLNTERDVRRKRRVLTPDELKRLEAAAEKSQDKLDRMRGSDRAMVYRLAAFTGLRAQEIASLTPRSFDLGRDAAYRDGRRVLFETPPQGRAAATRGIARAITDLFDEARGRTTARRRKTAVARQVVSQGR